MKNRSFRIFALSAALISLLASCKKIVVDNQVYVDSYIHAINNRAGVPVYGLVHSAYSNTALSGVSVKGSTGSALALTKGAVDGYSFFSIIDSTSYKTTAPASDTYTYNATYVSGAVAIVTDLTSGQPLLPARLQTPNKTATDIVLVWSPVVNADAYKVRIYFDDGGQSTRAMIYESNFLVPSSLINDLTIPFSLANLSQYLTSYLTFEVSAFIFEKDQDTFEAVSTATYRNKFITSN